MVNKNSVLVVIPARGGSKGLPRKNIRLLNGIPLIAYSIAAGLQSKLVTRVIVSTDDNEIAQIAKKYGSDVPFLRPKKLAQDNTLDLPVFVHALHWLEKYENYIPEIVVHLRPTSPLRPQGIVDRAINLFRSKKNVDCVRGVIPSGQNPYKMWRFDKMGYMRPLLSVKGISEPYNAPRQKLPSTYWQTGHIDVIRTKTIMTKTSMTGDRILPLIIDPIYAIDIDTKANLMLAEWVVKNHKLSVIQPKKSTRGRRK